MHPQGAKPWHIRHMTNGKTGGGTGTTTDIHGVTHIKGTAKQQPAPAPLVGGAPDLLAQFAPVESAPHAEGFRVHEPVWTGIATQVGDYPGSVEEARRLAGHNWEPEETVLFTPGPDGSLQPVPGSKAIRRNDTHEILGVCNNSRESIGIGDMYELVENLVDQPDVRWEAGGVLGGGRQAWVMCKLDTPIKIPGDAGRVYPHLTVVNRLVGPGACSLEWTAMRDTNSTTLSLNEIDSHTPPLRYQLRHTKNWRTRAEQISEAVMGVKQQSAAWQQAADYLAAQHITPEQRRTYLARFIPMPPEGMISDQVKENVLEARGQIERILNSRSCEGIDKTAWGLVQASAEYLDHVRFYRSAESRFKRCLLRPEPLKRKAVQIVRDII